MARGMGIDSILSPVVLCYGLGLLLNFFLPHGMILVEVLNTTMEVSIALAIPLILMNAKFKAFLQNGPEVIRSFLIAVGAAIVVCILGGFLFKNQTSKSADIAAMLAGVYTGGTPNMAAIKIAIGADENLFGALNIADILFGGMYLIFLTTIGPKVFRMVLKQKAINPQPVNQADDRTGNIWSSLTIRNKAKSLLLPFILSILSVAIAAGMSWLVFNELSMSFFVVLLTSFGILISLSPWQSRLLGSYEAGDYLLLVFCFCLGLFSNLSDLADSSLTIIYFTAFVLFTSIFLHLLLARVFNIDADITLITSVACIFGPLFVGQVVSVMKNKNMIIPGMTLGVAGIAIGSFVGIFIHKILVYLL